MKLFDHSKPIDLHKYNKEEIKINEIIYSELKKHSYNYIMNELYKQFHIWLKKRDFLQDKYFLSTEEQKKLKKLKNKITYSNKLLYDWKQNAENGIRYKRK